MPLGNEGAAAAAAARGVHDLESLRIEIAAEKFAPSTLWVHAAVFSSRGIAGDEQRRDALLCAPCGNGQ